MASPFTATYSAEQLEEVRKALRHQLSQLHTRSAIEQMVNELQLSSTDTAPLQPDQALRVLQVKCGACLMRTKRGRDNAAADTAHTPPVLAHAPQDKGVVEQIARSITAPPQLVAKHAATNLVQAALAPPHAPPRAPGERYLHVKLLGARAVMDYVARAPLPGEHLRLSVEVLGHRCGVLSLPPPRLSVGSGCHWPARRAARRMHASARARLSCEPTLVWGTPCCASDPHRARLCRLDSDWVPACEEPTFSGDLYVPLPSSSGDAGQAPSKDGAKAGGGKQQQPEKGAAGLPDPLQLLALRQPLHLVLTASAPTLLPPASELVATVQGARGRAGGGLCARRGSAAGVCCACDSAVSSKGGAQQGQPMWPRQTPGKPLQESRRCCCWPNAGAVCSRALFCACRAAGAAGGPLARLVARLQPLRRGGAGRRRLAHGAAAQQARGGLRADERRAR